MDKCSNIQVRTLILSYLQAKTVKQIDISV